MLGWAWWPGPLIPEFLNPKAAEAEAGQSLILRPALSADQSRIADSRGLFNGSSLTAISANDPGSGSINLRHSRLLQPQGQNPSRAQKY